MDIIPYCDLKVNRISADFYSKVKIAEIHSCDSSKNRTLRKRRLCSVIPYFFVYCDAESERRNIQNGLDYLAEERYNPNAPGGTANLPQSMGAFPYDHITDHNRLRRTWRQWRKERRRVRFPEWKGPNVVHAHVTPGSNAFGTTRLLVRNQSLGPENPLKS